MELDITTRLNSGTTSTTRTFYDGEGHEVETRQPAPGRQDVVQYTLYNVAGEVAAESVPYLVPSYTGSPGAAAYSIPDSTQSATTTTYDGLGRTLSTTDPLSEVTQATYSAICGVSGFNDSGCYEQTLTVDADNHQHGVLTDGFGRKTYDQSYTGNSPSTYAVYATTVTHYTYTGQVASIQQPANGTTTYTYDTAGRMTALSDPDLGNYTFGYDANGNLTSSSDPRGAAGTIYLGYDGQNRLVWKSTHSDGSSPLASYTYDQGTNGIGHPTGETFASGPNQSVTGSYAFTYDALGHQTGWTMSIGGNNYAFSMGYNDAGQQTSLTYPDGDTLTTGYDDNGWLQGVTETPQGGSAVQLLSAPLYTGSGGAAGLPTSAQIGNGTSTWTWTYDPLARLTGIQAQVTSGGGTLFNQTRSFDAVGNVSSVQTTLPAGTDNQVCLTRKK